MREILFKAKRKDWRNLPKEEWWVEGYYRADPDLYTHYICGWNYYASENGFERESFEEEINYNTLCQYTGLTDKNDKKIWENDIVKVSTNKGNTLCEVRYADNVAQFQLWQFTTLPRTATVLNLGNYEEKVIGNIFDNPDLVEV